MKMYLLMLSLILTGLQNMAYARTWERCNGITKVGSTTLSMSSLIHETFEDEYLIDFSIKGKPHYEDRLHVLVQEDNTSIRYTNDRERFAFIIDTSSCKKNQCPAEVRTSSGDLEKIMVTCEFNIRYTEPTGSGGRCGGRRC